LCALLRNSKVSFEPHPNAPNCIVLQDATAEAVPGFREGFFYVQDPSTLLAVELLEPRPGEMVLDACAAPGGKCLYIAEKMQNRGRIVACDVSAKRLELLRENCARLGAGIVEPRQWDFESGEEKGVGTRVRDEDVALTTAAFDRVLVDAPCSNTGVMRRRVDVRWRLRPEDFRRMAARQLKLLRSAAALVTNGGALVYSTCSLESEENEEAVAAFLKSAPRFKLLETRAMFSPRDGMDGAFVAKFVRE
jgi:16S rRNA (cytosine967-C5)-methyltransferase